MHCLHCIVCSLIVCLEIVDVDIVGLALCALHGLRVHWRGWCVGGGVRHVCTVTVARAGVAGGCEPPAQVLGLNLGRPLRAVYNLLPAEPLPYFSSSRSCFDV